MKSNHLFLYLAVFFLFSINFYAMEDTDNFGPDTLDNLIAKSDIKPSEVIRIKQLVTNFLAFRHGCILSLEEEIRIIEGMQKNKDGAVSKDNNIARSLLPDVKTEGKEVYSKDNRFIIASGTHHLVKKPCKYDADTEFVTASLNRANKLSFPLTELSAISLASRHLAKSTTDYNDLLSLNEHPTDSAQMKSLKKMLLYLHYDRELLTLGFPFVLIDWTMKTPNPCAQAFFDHISTHHVLQSMSQKGRDIFDIFVKKQPHIFDLLNKMIKIMLSNRMYAEESKWLESDFSKKSLSALKVSLEHAKSDSKVCKKIYADLRAFLVSKKKIDLLKKHQPFFDETEESGVTLLLPFRLDDTSNTSTPTQTDTPIQPKENVPHVKEHQIDNKKSKNKKTIKQKKSIHKPIQKNDKKKEQIEKQELNDVLLLEPIAESELINNGTSDAPTNLTMQNVPNILDLTDLFLQECQPILHYHTHRFACWRNRSDDYHKIVPHIADAYVLKYGNRKQYAGKSGHFSYYTFCKITKCDGTSSWGIFSLTVNEHGVIYHRHFIPTNDIFDTSTYINKLGPDYDQNIYELEYPSLSTATAIQNNSTSSAHTISVAELMTHPKVITAHGTTSVPSELMRDALVIEYNNFFIRLNDKLTDCEVALLCQRYIES